MKKISHHCGLLQTVLIVIFFWGPWSVSYSKTITQFTPKVTITEEYSDNYFKTHTNKQEEFITSYGLGFSVGFLNKKSKIYLGYNPKYKDYKNFDNLDDFEHIASLDMQLTPSKNSHVNGNVYFTSNNQENTGQSWSNSASLSGDTKFTKNSKFTFSEVYSQNYDQQQRTGSYKKHNVNRSEVGISNKYGANDIVGMKFSYAFDDYKNSDADEYKKYRPSAYITHWVSSLNGIDSNIAFAKTDFDNSNNDVKQYSGHIRYLRKFSKHFNGFVKYRHSYSERDSGNHHIYHPSVGFDWEVTEDSGVSLGLGALISQWDNTNDDTTDPFFDINVYKTFNFSKRGSLSLTGSSGYDETSEDAASLGYNTYYRAGFKLNYLLDKHLSSDLFGSYRISEYSENTVNRKDNTIFLGAGLNWMPLRWLNFNLRYTYEDYNTDTSSRNDYTENKATFSISFIPTKPIRPDFTPSRTDLESEIY